MAIKQKKAREVFIIRFLEAKVTTDFFHADFCFLIKPFVWDKEFSGLVVEINYC